MAARKKKASSSTRPYTLLEQEVNDLRLVLGNLLERAGRWFPDRFGRETFEERDFTETQDLVAFRRYLASGDELAAIAQAMNPRDISWRYYATSRARVDEQLAISDPLHIENRGKRPFIRWYAASALRSALEAVEGALSRTRPPTLEPATRSSIQTLADAMVGAPERSDRVGARAVLGDLLEEIGLTGEAFAVRRGMWRYDEGVLRPLGIGLPKRMPVDLAYNRLGNAR